MMQLETYLLRTGKFRLFFSTWLYCKYMGDINKLYTFLINWQVIKEGYRMTEGFEIFRKAYAWSYLRYFKAIELCRYLQLADLYSDPVTGAWYIRLHQRLTKPELFSHLSENKMTHGTH